VSSTAQACPQCGAKPRPVGMSPRQLWIGSSVAALAVLGLFSKQRPVDDRLKSAEVAVEKGNVAVNEAYGLCQVFESSGMTTGCEVNGWNSSVDVMVDMTSREAFKLCDMTANKIAPTTSFNGTWKLRIVSPYSGDKAIAVCNLK